MLKIAKSGSAFFFLFYIFSSLIPIFFWIFKIPTSFYLFQTSLLFTCLTYWKIFWSKEDAKSTFYALGIGVLLISFFSGLSYNMIDLSPDSKSDHLEYLLYMKHGWNPIYDPSVTHFRNNLPPDYPIQWGFSADTYIKIIATKLNYSSKLVFIHLFDSVEAGIITNFLLGTILFFFSIIFSLKYCRNRLDAILLCIAANMNPIVIIQFFSNYMDGNHGILSGIVICLTLIILKKYPAKSDLVFWALGIALLANVKLSAAFFAFWLGLTGIVLFYAKYREVFYRTYLLAIAMTFLIGFNPFIVHFNLYAGGVLKRDMRSIVGSEANPWPSHKDYVDSHSQVTFFYKSLMAQFAGNPNEFKLRAPFLFHKDELIEVKRGNVDSRSGGFGVFFSACYIFSLLFFIFAMRRKWKSSPFIYCAYLFLSIHLSVLIFPHSWWARFVPILYWCPLLLALPVYYSGRYRLLSYGVLGLLVFNTVLYGTYHFTGQYFQQKIVKDSILVFSKLEGIHKFWFSNQLYFQSYFKKSSIPFEILKNKKDCNGEILRFIFFELELCSERLTLNDQKKLCKLRKDTNHILRSTWGFDPLKYPGFCSS